ncbi:TetR/AcrR family transcriptional regulator [Williamsia sp.]|uniref:TetR/AcrR family transcriptional regulator n=1 Tax=Williamsia sp. TaxID=1872085 RepID=UPI001A1A2DD4|nr:TetR/AcrR family transcriptional regulator [Williamsia sp.]MBJ7287942.1 TetR/AcrR family transcriptional regulator [Williamsia sp.]
MTPTRRRGTELDDAIHRAVFGELVDHGYVGLTFEGVARRAQTSKPVLYRRWPNRLDMVVAALTSASDDVIHAADTGSLASDVEATLQLVLDRLESMGRSIALGVLADAAASPGTGTLRILQTKGIALSDTILERARARGEIGPAPLPERVRSLPFDMARYEFLVNGDLTADAIHDIVTTVFCPLVTLLSSGSDQPI